MSVAVTRSKWFQLVLVAIGMILVFGLYIISSLHFSELGLMAPDEGYFTLAARSVYEGKLPYADFAYTQAPLLPYINGFFLNLSDFTLQNHRLVNSIWGFLGLLTLVLAIRKRTGLWEPALLVGFVLAAAPRWVFLQSMAVWCGLTGFFVSVAIASILWPGPVVRRSIVFAVGAALALGCRLTCAPLLAIAFLSFLFEMSEKRERLIAVGSSATAILLVFVPFIIIAPGNFFELAWQFHIESEASRSVYTRLSRAYEVSPGAFVLLVVALFGIPSLIQKRRFTELCLLAAALLGNAVLLVPSSSWGVYVSSGAPLAAAAGVISFRAVAAQKGVFRYASWLLPLLILVPRFALPIEIPEGAANEVDLAAAFIKKNAGPGPVLTPASIVALHADRAVIKGTEMGQFGVISSKESNRAADLNMVTLPTLTKVVRNREAAAIVLMSSPPIWLEWNFARIFPATLPQPKSELEAFSSAVENNYTIEKRLPTMNVLFPRSDPPGGEK